MPGLHVACALDYYSTVKFMLEEMQAGDAEHTEMGVERGVNEHEPLLSRCPLHLAAAAASPRLVRLLISQPTVEVEARDASGQTALEMVRCMLDAIDEGLGNAALHEQLAKVR